MQIPKLTQQQLMYCIIAIMLFVILIFVVRDYQAQRYINAQAQVANNNLDWLADRCGCVLEEEITEYRQEQISQAANNAYDITQQFT